MKLKKIFLSLGIVTALLAGGCSKQQSQPTLNKTQVIKKAEKTFKSGQAKQVVNLRTDTNSQTVSSAFTFGGDPTVFHLNYQTEDKNKTKSLEEWISNTGNVYVNGQSDWYKAEMEKMTGHTYADLLDAITNNELLTDPPQSLVKAYQLTRNGDTYTLKATINDKKIMQQAIEPIFLTNTQNPKQTNIYQSLAKNGKFQDMSVKLVVKNQKLFSFKYDVNIRVDKLMMLSVSQSYSNIGSKDFLKIPTNALNAKPIAKANKKK